MKRLLLNTGIGLKLGFFSGLAILTVVGMIATMLRGDATVQRANERASVQQTIVKDAIEAEVSVRGMQVGVRDLRLARSNADIDRARESIATHQKSATSLVEQMFK